MFARNNMSRRIIVRETEFLSCWTAVDASYQNGILAQVPVSSEDVLPTYNLTIF